MKNMKKYLAIFSVLFTVIFSSCSNDDIPVGQSITFKINPSTVVASLVEYEPGDLSSIQSNQKLYVSLYVYNKSGNLIASDVQKFSDYTHIMNSVQNLGSGEYTVVVSTHIVNDSGLKYWSFSGVDNLSTFSVTDEGYIGGSAKILGLTAKHITITSSVNEVLLDVECAGAVALVQVMNWNRYSDVEAFGLLSNKSCDNVTFDYNGSKNYSIETKSDYGYWMFNMDYDSNYNGGYGYTFMFPCTNMNMTFAAETTSNDLVYIGESCTGNIEMGHTYWFAYDVTNEETYWSDETGYANNVVSRVEERVPSWGDGNLLKFDVINKRIRIAE